MDPMKRIIIVRFLFLSPSPTLTNLENTDLRAKGPEQRSRPVLSIVPSYQPQDSVLDARRVRAAYDWSESWNCRDNRFSASPRGRTYVRSRYECRIDTWIDNVDLRKRVFIVFYTEKREARRPIFDRPMSCYLSPINRLITSRVNNRWHYRADGGHPSSVHSQKSRLPQGIGV